MSKKKAFSGSTMTLKDFHGGSIPSDLPLPSAPGVIVRPVDRYDRQTSWGNRLDLRSRPNSSPSVRHIDDKTPFLTHSPHIGLNFDEDERTPLDGVTGPRRTVSDDGTRIQSRRVELKPEVASSGWLSGWQGLTPVSQLRSGTGRVVEEHRHGLNSQNLGSNRGHAISSGHQNAWAGKREMAAVITKPVQSAWSGPSVESKLAHASALEKVSSGRWQSKYSDHFQTDVEVVRHLETGNGVDSSVHGSKSNNKINVVGGRDYYDARLARHAERGLNIDDRIQGSSKESIDYDRAATPMNSEAKDSSLKIHSDVVQQATICNKHGGSDLQPLVPSEAIDRPKLKLLPRRKPLDSSEPPSFEHKEVLTRTKALGSEEPPVLEHKEVLNRTKPVGSSEPQGLEHKEVLIRTKPLESSERPAIYHKQEYRWPSNSVQAETLNHLDGKVNPVKPWLPGRDSDNQTATRPKLNLKPRSKSLEHLEVDIERHRSALFGGARPRELVLKERGINNVAIENHVSVQHSERVKHNVSNGERVSGHANPSHHNEKTENLPVDQKIEKKTDSKDQWTGVERVDLQGNQHTGNWRNRRGETERWLQPHMQHQERPPSLETWRKPVDQPKPVSLGGKRFGKAASALELAEAFSRSVSDSKMAGQRGLPAQTQVLFSRLTGPIQKRQINGY